MYIYIDIYYCMWYSDKVDSTIFCEICPWLLGDIQITSRRLVDCCCIRIARWVNLCWTCWAENPLPLRTTNRFGDPYMNRSSICHHGFWGLFITWAKGLRTDTNWFYTLHGSWKRSEESGCISHVAWLLSICSFNIIILLGYI